MNFTHLLVEDRGAVRWITLNRPEKLNALNRATLGELHAAFEAAGSDDGGARGGADRRRAQGLRGRCRHRRDERPDRRSRAATSPATASA